MKVLSHRGYDVMKIEVEESSWWYPIFRKSPRRETYMGTNATWQNSSGGMVFGKKRYELEKIWADLREQARASRDKARGRV